MNYLQATKGSMTRSQAIREVLCQSEFELGRPLSKAEETSLFEKFSPQLIAERIGVVRLFIKIFCYIQFIFTVWLWDNQVSYVDMQSACVEM